MLTAFYKAAHATALKGRAAMASLTAEFADAICPGEHAGDLEQCGRQSQDFLQGVMRISANRNPAELCLLNDFFEDCKDFTSYRDLMNLFAEEDQYGDEACPAEDCIYPIAGESWRQQYPQTYYLTRTAKSYMNAFQHLPGAVQYMLNKSLSLQVQLLRSQVEGCMQDTFGEPDPH